MKRGGFTPRRSDLRTIRWTERWYEKHAAAIPGPLAILLLLFVVIEILLSGTKDWSFRHGP